jgi:hypothetical protein
MGIEHVEQRDLAAIARCAATSTVVFGRPKRHDDTSGDYSHSLRDPTEDV